MESSRMEQSATNAMSSVRTFQTILQTYPLRVLQNVVEDALSQLKPHNLGVQFVPMLESWDVSP